VRLKDEVGMTLVLITHDLAFAWALADRVAIMYLGKIVELGPAQTVLTELLHPYTKSLLAVTPEVGRRRTHKVLTGEPPDPAHIPRAAASTPAVRCCARERRAPRNPAAWERSLLSRSLCPAIEQPATWPRPKASELAVPSGCRSSTGGP
jgi:oligopeptide/dipeptide ABC transporter ATP-binding protein